MDRAIQGDVRWRCPNAIPNVVGGPNAGHDAAGRRHVQLADQNLHDLCEQRQRVEQKLVQLKRIWRLRASERVVDIRFDRTKLVRIGTVGQLCLGGQYVVHGCRTVRRSLQIGVGYVAITQDRNVQRRRIGGTERKRVRGRGDGAVECIPRRSQPVQRSCRGIERFWQIQNREPIPHRLGRIQHRDRNGGIVRTGTLARQQACIRHHQHGGTGLAGGGLDSRQKVRLCDRGAIGPRRYDKACRTTVVIKQTHGGIEVVGGAERFLVLIL